MLTTQKIMRSMMRKLRVDQIVECLRCRIGPEAKSRPSHYLSAPGYSTLTSVAVEERPQGPGTRRVKIRLCMYVGTNQKSVRVQTDYTLFSASALDLISLTPV